MKSPIEYQRISNNIWKLVAQNILKTDLENEKGNGEENGEEKEKKHKKLSIITKIQIELVKTNSIFFVDS